MLVLVKNAPPSVATVPAPAASAVEIVVEVMGGLEPARSLILRAIAAGKPVVTANKAVIARHGDDFRAMIEEGIIDILFVNESELATLTGEDDFEALIDINRQRLE